MISKRSKEDFLYMETVALRKQYLHLDKVAWTRNLEHTGAVIKNLPRNLEGFRPLWRGLEGSLLALNGLEIRLVEGPFWKHAEYITIFIWQLWFFFCVLQRFKRTRDKSIAIQMRKIQNAELNEIGELFLISFSFIFILPCHLLFLFLPFKSEMPLTVTKCPLSSGFLRRQKLPCLSSSTRKL